jgi:hypothetical protein
LQRKQIVEKLPSSQPARRGGELATDTAARLRFERAMLDAYFPRDAFDGGERLSGKLFHPVYGGESWGEEVAMH